MGQKWMKTFPLFDLKKQCIFCSPVCLLLLVLGMCRHELTELFRGKCIPDLDEVGKKWGRKRGLQAGFEGSNRKTGVNTLAFSC